MNDADAVNEVGEHTGDGPPSHGLSEKHNGVWADDFWSEAIDVVACAGGPLLVRRGDSLSPDDPGRGRRVVAICRCDKSSLFPLCDGTHKTLNRKLRST